jgi:hypothetical protein
MSTRPKVGDFDDAGTDLENALTQIYGLSKVLMELGVYDDVPSYLGGQLHDHAAEAQDAFKRIFGLGEHSPQRAGDDDAGKGGAA